MSTSQGAIYFDGLCIACATEINHYRKLPGSENFQFIDITASHFNAESHGIDPFLVHKVMHVRDPNGNLHQGVDAFRAIWREIPRYQFLYRLSEKRPVRALLEVGYKAFVKIRPLLPRKKSDCSDSPYCEIKKT
jgi:predicted DCC family thiol-disulfide oxidoreductase YuxK